MSTDIASPPPDDPERGPSGMRTLFEALRRGLSWLTSSLAGQGISPINDLRAAFIHINRGRLLWGLLGLAVFGYLLTGVYVVAPGEAAVVRRFGEVVEPRAAPGLHYRIPWPIDRVDVININEIRRETVGLLEPEEDHIHPEDPSKLQALSGDTNVVDVEIIVQYQVRDPVKYLLNIQYPPYQLVRGVTRQAVTRLVTTQPVDALLTTERQALQGAIRTEVQKRLDEYGSGLIIVGINLQKAFPPAEVAAAFTDVNSAREDKVRAVNEATGYANSLIPETRGQAQQIGAQAEAYRSDALSRANGGALAFQAVLAEYQSNSLIYGEEVTRYRLFLETLEIILPRVQVYALDMTNGGSVSLRLFGDPPSESPLVP